MAYELFLIRLASAPGGGLKELRRAAIEILPADDPLCEVRMSGGGRFEIETRSCRATVRADGAEFRIDDFDAYTVPLVYALAKTGGLVVTNSRGPSETIVVDRAQLKHLPSELRDPKPALCRSAEELARLLGVTPKQKTRRPKAAVVGPYDWSGDHEDRRLGRGDPEPRLPGLRETAEQRHVYVQLKSDEGPLLAMKRFGQFMRGMKKKKSKLAWPEGGGVGNSDWLIRLPGGEVLVPWDVTGYHWRANSNHLIPDNIEAWLAILREFGRQTGRALGSVSGKTFVLDDGRSYPLTACESRRARDADG